MSPLVSLRCVFVLLPVSLRFILSCRASCRVSCLSRASNVEFGLGDLSGMNTWVLSGVAGGWRDWAKQQHILQLFAQLLVLLR